jgi:hypothetical protein
MVTSPILAGCPTRASWVIAGATLLWTGVVLYVILRRPQLIKNDWARSRKHLLAIAVLLIGLFFVLSSVHDAVTGHCLGTDLDSSSRSAACISH